MLKKEFLKLTQENVETGVIVVMVVFFALVCMRIAWVKWKEYKEGQINTGDDLGR